MEDAHCHILSLSPEDPDLAYFGVFDGHGGSKVAAYAANNLHRYIVNREEYKDDDKQEAIKQGFLECDRTMKTVDSLKDEMAGCTAITVFIKGKELWCANAGDSRCVAGVAGTSKPLSSDHKPMDVKERERIEAAGGFVEFNRVNGNLALSRALGDFVFKMNDQLPQSDQIVTCLPDILHEIIGPEWDFIILACDGIWDVLSSQEVTDFITERIARGMEPEDICEDLMNRCLSPDCQMGGLGCDNMTCVLVCFLHGKPYQDLVDKCAKIIKSNPVKDNSCGETEDEDEENQILETDTAEIT